jgi:hypothetical protein
MVCGGLGDQRQFTAPSRSSFAAEERGVGRASSPLRVRLSGQAASRLRSVRQTKADFEAMGASRR